MANQLLLYGVWSKRTDVTLLGENAEDAKEFDHTLLYRFVDGQWSLQKLLKWSAAGIATDLDDNVLIVGGDGEFAVERNGQFSEDMIPRMPTIAGLFRLPTGLFAVGLSSRIYRYQGGTQWALDTAGIEGEDDDFWCIAGNSHITYVAGSSGCCYVRQESAWVQEVLPTNNHLKGVAIDDSGNVVIGGWRGTLIIGRAGAWTLVDHNYPHDDFYCVRYYEDTFYLAGKQAIYRVTIGEPNTVEPIFAWELFDKGLFSDMFYADGKGLVVLSQDGIFVKGATDWRIVR